jgi:endonuclease G
MPDSDIHWVANEGVRVSSICEALITAKMDDAFRDQWASLIETFQEDFSMMPILQSPVRDAGAVTTSIDPRRGVSIVVNGTANFYVGEAPESPTDRARVASSRSGTTPAADEKKLVFDPNYDNRPGYKADFLKVPAPLPRVVKARSGELLVENGKPRVLKYHHYSIVLNKLRRLQMWSAVNVDYTASKRRKKREDFGTDTWVADPRIAGELQIEDQQLYDPAKKFDRGHIVRRDDTAWGDTEQEEVFANSDSFHWTNCTPQHEQFNRDMYQFHGLWGALEHQIQTQAKNVGERMSIFAGPILDNTHDIKHDFGGGEMLVPVRFWKVVIVTENAASHPKVRTYGFVLDQTSAIQKYGLEKFSAGDFQTYQVRLKDITAASGVTFAKALLNADAMAGAPDEASRINITSLDKIRL